MKTYKKCDCYLFFYETPLHFTPLYKHLCEFLWENTYIKGLKKFD